MNNIKLNKNLHAAKRNKNDEFYTQLPDIERELVYYKGCFKGKTVFCNCDDPEKSNFWNYFALNFEYLGLKRLVSIHFEIDKPSYKLEIISDINNDGKINKLDTIKTPLKQNGDFRSDECIEILQECDIVITNPPFSLFREYIAQLMGHNKKFIVIGNMNAITYKEIFPLIKNNKLWLGYTSPKTFVQPDGSIKKLGCILWFTNLEIEKRCEDLILYKTYYGHESKYPKYDNYDAINVDKVKDIPTDYSGVIGVPITFLCKYNPEQFEIIALGNSRENFTPTKDYINPKKVIKDGLKINGGAINCVLAIKINKKLIDKVYYTSENEPLLTAPYARILIKNKKIKITGDF